MIQIKWCCSNEYKTNRVIVCNFLHLLKLNDVATNINIVICCEHRNFSASLSFMGNYNPSENGGVIELSFKGGAHL